LFEYVDDYIGLDICTSGHNHKNSKVDVFYDGQIIPFNDNSFDAVLSFEVFEHVFNLSTVLDEIKRVLKQDGLLLISIPFAWGEHEIPYDFARYSSYGISNIFIQNQFEIIKIEKTTSHFLAIGQLFINYISNIVFPKNKMEKLILQIIIVFPMTLMFLLADRLFPKDTTLYCNLIILCRQIRK
jgi:SAM-dependent methyltransferase